MSNSQSSKQQHGVGAIAQVYKRFLHPSKVIKAKYPNMRGDDKLEGLIELRREKKQVNKRTQMCIVMRHEDFANTELHAVERWVKVTTSSVSTFVPDDDDAEEPPTEGGGGYSYFYNAWGYSE